MESYENFIEYLNTKKNICIVGKGSTSENYDKEIDGTNITKGFDENTPKYDLYIGIKQAILLLKHKDILVMNDYEGLFGCEAIFKELKYIVCPYYPHINQVFNTELNYNAIVFYANKYGFKGKFVIYNLIDKHNIIIPKLLNITSFTSGDIIFNFLNLCPNKKNININLYGIGTTNKDNPQIFELMLRNHTKNNNNRVYINYLIRRYTKKTGDNTDTCVKLNHVKSKIEIFKDLKVKFN